MYRWCRLDLGQDNTIRIILQIMILFHVAVMLHKCMNIRQLELIRRSPLHLWITVKIVKYRKFFFINESWRVKLTAIKKRLGRNY